MLKSIIFDLDGTLLDTSEGIWNSIKDTISHYSMQKIPDEIKSKFIGPPIKESFKHHYNLDETKAIEMMQYFRKCYVDKHLFEAKIYDGIEETLACLQKKYSLFVATNKREDYAVKILDYFELSNYFNNIYGTDYEGKITKIDVIKKCITRTNHSLDEILMIGDSNDDKKGAELNGISFLSIGYGFGFGKNASVHKTSDIVPVINSKYKEC